MPTPIFLSFASHYVEQGPIDGIDIYGLGVGRFSSRAVTAGEAGCAIVGLVDWTGETGRAAAHFEWINQAGLTVSEQDFEIAGPLRTEDSRRPVAFGGPLVELVPPDMYEVRFTIGGNSVATFVEITP